MTGSAPGPGPKPGGPTHPTPTGPPKQATAQTPGPPDAAHSPSGVPGIDPTGAAPPRLGEVIRDVERLLAQAVTILRRDIDPASEPTVLAWPALADGIYVHQLLLAEVAVELGHARLTLGKVAALPMPAAGSAVPFARRPS